jgi:hypothetical protein
VKGVPKIYDGMTPPGKVFPECPAEPARNHRLAPANDRA